MQIRVTVNDVDFAATLDAGAAGQDLLARLPLTLQMQELHGNEKYCYTGKAFGGQEQAPTTIAAGELMAFSGDCLVLFYETFDNGGWAYQRVGAIDDVTGLAEACGQARPRSPLLRLSHSAPGEDPLQRRCPSHGALPREGQRLSAWRYS